MPIVLELHILDEELIISTRDHFKEELVHKYRFPKTAGMFLSEVFVQYWLSISVMF